MLILTFASAALLGRAHPALPSFSPTYTSGLSPAAAAPHSASCCSTASICLGATCIHHNKQRVDSTFHRPGEGLICFCPTYRNLEVSMVPSKGLKLWGSKALSGSQQYSE